MEKQEIEEPNLLIKLQKGGLLNNKVIAKPDNTLVKNGVNTRPNMSKYMSTSGSSIGTPYSPSWREKIMRLADKVDNNGENAVAGLVTQPIKSAMRLLRPDNYFRSDDVVGNGGGGLQMIMDAAAVAPVVGGVSKAKSLLTNKKPSIKGNVLLPKNKTNTYDLELNEFENQLNDLSLNFSTKTVMPEMETAKRQNFLSHLKKVSAISDDEVLPLYEKYDAMGVHPRDIGYLVKNNFKNDIRLYQNTAPIQQNPSPAKLLSDRFIETHKLPKITNPKDDFLIDSYTSGYDNYYNKRSFIGMGNEIEDFKSAINTNADALEDLILQNKAKKNFEVRREVRDWNIPVVYRKGKELKNMKRSELMVGDEFEPNSFQSTTIGPRDDFFATGYIGSDKMLETIKIPAGKQSILFPNTSNASNYPGELEVLLPRKLRMQVTEATHPTFKLKIMNPYLQAGALTATGLGLKDN